MAGDAEDSGKKDEKSGNQEEDECAPAIVNNKMKFFDVTCHQAHGEQKNCRK